MNENNSKKIWNYIQDAGNKLVDQLPPSRHHPKGRNPYAQVGLTLLSVFGPQQITDAIFQPQQFSNVANQVQDRQLQLRNKNNVVVVEDETDETNIGGSLPVGDASSLLVLSSSNLDNPYLTNSYIQYNIML